MPCRCWHCAIGAGAAWAPTSAGAERFKNDVAGHASTLYPKLEALYKDIHANPELAFEEVKARLAKEMRELGFEVTEGVGKTGVVGMCKKRAGPTVLVRTELDALPMEEKTGLPYASKVEDHLPRQGDLVAHSCGHDLHMASWVGTAQDAGGDEEPLAGHVDVHRAAGRGDGGGAKAMLQDGLFTRFGKPDVAFALHTWPMAYGIIGFNVGPMTSNSDGFEIIFKGRGAHGSAPDKSIDPVMIASRFVVDVQAVISREKDPFEFGVFSIGSIQGGTRRQHHSRQRRDAWHDPQLHTCGAREDASTASAARRKRGGGDGRRARARTEDRLGRRSGRQQRGAGGQGRASAEGSVR